MCGDWNECIGSGYKGGRIEWQSVGNGEEVRSTSTTSMEPGLRLKVALSKMGTQVKRAERNVKLMDNRMKVAQRDLALLKEYVNVVKWQVEELKTYIGQYSTG